MRKIFTLFFAIFMALTLWAEVPQTISYQAVVRNHVGQLVKNSPVGVRITILHNDEAGGVVYEETRTVVSNVNGLLTFAIGDSKATSTYSLSDVDWSDGTYFIRCEYDLNGGTNYELTTTTQIKSVPYALYAEKVSLNALPTWAQTDEKPTYNYTEISGAPTSISELTNDSKFVTEESIAEKYQPKGEYLTEHQSLADYAKKEELPNVPTKVSELTNDKGFITAADIPTVQVPSLVDYAKKSDLPKADSLLSKDEASATYQPKGEYLTEHQSLSDYAKKTDLPTVPTKVSELTNDAGYVTESSINTTLNTINVSELVNDAEYVKKEELPNVPTKVSELTNDKGYLTEHQSLTAYAKKTDLPNVPTKVSELTNDKGYLTEHQSLTAYAKKTDLPTVPTKVSELTNDAGYVTESSINTTLNTINVSELVNDAEYVKKEELPNVPTKVSELTNDKGFITAADIPTVQVPSLVDYAKKSDLPKADSLLSKDEASATYQLKGEYLTEHQSLTAYAKKTDLPTVPTKVSAFENDANYLTEHQSLEAYAKKTDLPTVPTKVSAFENDANYLTEHQSLIAYAKKTDLPTVPTKVSAFENDANYLTEHQSLTAYAKKTDLPTVPTKVSAFENDANYLTEHQSLTAYAKKTDLPTVPTKVSAFENDANYLTEHQSLTAYAKKTDLPTVPTKVSAFENDANYLTEHQSLEDYAKKSELPTVPTKVSAFENDATYIKKSELDSLKLRIVTLEDELKNVQNNSSQSGNVIFKYTNDLLAFTSDGGKTWYAVTRDASFELPKSSGKVDGYEYVDLGLPSGLKWATMNVGAKEENDFGTRFQWGEITPAPNINYIYANCKAYGKSSSTLKTSGVIDANGNLTADYDAATQNWSENWRMPTKEEFEELLKNCTWTSMTLGGVSGFKIESKKEGNTNWIFFPMDYQSGMGYNLYWSSSVYASEYSWHLWNHNSDGRKMHGEDRRKAWPVRPVVSE